MPTVATIPRPCEFCDVADAKAERRAELLFQLLKLVDVNVYRTQPEQDVIRAVRGELADAGKPVSADEVRYREACRKWGER